MGQALLQLLPLALAAALSSVTLTATIFILLSESRSRSGLAFLVGTALGTFAAVVLATVLSAALPGRPRPHDELLGKLEIAIGIAMVVLGVVTLARRTPAIGGRGTGWLDDIGSFGILPVFGIGLALNIRPKALLLVVAAGLAISKADLPLDLSLLLVLFYTAIATSTVLVPVVATILFPERMEPRLLLVKEWIAAHSIAVGGTLTILVGVFVIGVGMSG